MNALDHTSPVEDKILAEVVYDILVNASIDLGAPGMDDRYGYGLPDAGLAVLEATAFFEPTRLNITLTPQTASVGEQVTVVAEAPGVTVPEGLAFRVMFDSMPIAEATWTSGLQASFTVPEKPRGIYNVTVYSVDRRYAGSAQLEVKPSIVLQGNITAGTSVVLEAYGHDAGRVYEVLLDGAPIGTITTDANGTGIGQVTIPRDTAPGAHFIATRDAGTSEILASKLVEITQATETPVQPLAQILLIHVSGPTSISVGEQVQVYVTAYTSLGPVNATMNSSLETPHGPGSPVVERLGPSLYRITFNATSEGYYALHIKASATIGNATLYAEAVHTVQASARITGALEQLQADVTAIQGTSNIILDRLNQTLEGVNATRSLLEDVIAVQYIVIEIIEARLYTLNENITTTVYAAASETMANLTRVIREASNATTNKLETLDAKLTRTHRLLETLDQQVNGVAEGLTRTEARLAVVEQGVNEARSRLTLLEAMLGEVKSTVDRLGESIARLQTGLDAMREETAASIQSLQESMATVSETLASQSRMLEELRNEVAGLKDTVAEAITGITGTLEELTTGLQDTNETVAVLEGEVSNARSEASQARQAGIAALGLSLVALGIGAARMLKS